MMSKRRDVNTCSRNWQCPASWTLADRGEGSERSHRMPLTVVVYNAGEWGLFSCAISTDIDEL